MAITTLNLEYNNIGDIGATALAVALKGHGFSCNLVVCKSTALTTLYLSYNNIEAIGAAALEEAMKGSTTLTTLNLGGQDNWAASLAEALKINTALTVVVCSIYLLLF